MAQPHNIAGSEAFSARPTVMVRELPRRRPRLSSVARFYLIVAIAGATASAIDLLIGSPVCFSLGAIIFLGLWLRG
jgi:hypothetical protein